ncbi:hypothetical protein KAS42_04205 [bacterium]|nr:hypothetical protein [bacterium]
MKNSNKGKKGIVLKPEISDDPNLSRVYSNYVSVATTPHECNITFCHIDPIRTSPKLEAKTVAKVTIPNSLVKEVIKVIESNYDNAMKKSLKK